MSAMSSGVTDGQRVAAFRDRYGKVLYGAMVAYLGKELNRLDGKGSAGAPTWEEETPEMRTYCGVLAEAVIAAFVTGEEERA